MPNRRNLLASVGTVAGAVLAGCNGLTGDEGDSDGADETATEATGTDDASSVGPETAVAAQLNVYRARVADAVALGRAGEPSAGAAVAGATFERFENAGGEYGAHESLERTSESAYEGFEAALGEVRSGLEAGDVGAAAEAADDAAGHLRTAQQALAGSETARALDALWYAARGADAAVLAAAGDVDAAGTVAGEALAAFEDALVHGVFEDADGDAYGAFEAGLETAANASDASEVRDGVGDALDAAVDGAYAMTGERAAGAAHLALFQARGYDAAALAGLGGPGESLAHAATLDAYRARIADVERLAERDATDAAVGAVGGVFEHFEGASAHDALEEADHDAYEGFEDGLSNLRSAIETGDGVADAVATVDDHLRTGIEALAGVHAAPLQAGFFKARLADARDRYAAGDSSGAAAVASDLFERFETDQLGFHETLEETDESLYERFEHDHLEALIEAYEEGNDGAVETHHAGAQSALTDYLETARPAVASAGEGTYMTGRGFDAAVLALAGDRSRAASVVGEAFEHFEAGAAGFHEALEEADHDAYEAFEADLGAVRSAAEDDGDVTAAAGTFFESGVEAVYAVVGAAGGGNGEAAASVVEDVFATFENAAVHETVESADREAYEGFEAALNDYGSALAEGETPVDAFADATLRAQFAVVGATEEAPIEADGGEEGGTDQWEGGPNVVDGVPEDADHVVAMRAVSYEPVELTVGVGDTVAFEHAEGEPHSVTAREDDLPGEADYWASGGFESEATAVEGWENGQGAVQSGQSYVYTFETAGEHPYYCIPHEAAGMEGTVVVEE